MHFKSIRLLLLAALVSSLFLTGCVPKQADATSDGRTIVTFWSFWGSETRRPVIDHIINEFNASQNEIQVKHVYLPWGDIWTKNLASIAAGNPADVIINDIASVELRASKKQNTNLTAYLEKDPIEDRFYPNLWEDVLYEGEAYALPFNTDTRMLYYNKQAFREAGLDPEQPPATWEELESYAIQLDIKEGNTYEQVGFHPLWGDFGVDNWLFNGDEGRGYFDDAGNPLIHTQHKIDTLEWLKSWDDRLGKKTVDTLKAEFGSKQSDPFLSGKVAMLIQQGNFATQIRDYGQGMDIGVAPIPERTEGSGHWSGGGGFVVEIPHGAKHPDEAWEFIKFLTDKQSQLYWAEKNFDNVANIEASEDPSLQQDPIYAASVTNLEVTKRFRAPLLLPDYKDMITSQLDQALLGMLPADQALANAEEDVNNLIRLTTPK